MMRMMKKLKASAVAVIFVTLVAIAVRILYFTNDSGKAAGNGYNATTWDALGYYMYLPGLLIYDDVKELKWFPAIDKKYNVSGGELYQATKLDDGNYAFKYLGGVAVMELPFFYIGHCIAFMTSAPEDGFSWPYQYAIIFGAVFWFGVGVIFLRKVLLRFYSEGVTAVTVLLLCLASNLLQYVSVDGAMSHAYIFPLYSMLLWFTIRWHEEPKIKYAAAVGFICGIAVISRPTELIMIFIPILWGLEKSGKLKTKWQLVRENKKHIIFTVTAGFLAVLPQLLYWKHATGSFVYDVGSKWYFLNPWWRVLLGFEKGWFIYTPIAIFMAAGLFFLKGKPFRRAVITFCLLNIWIIISWSDWRYGASYSTRALTQSYPVFALSLAAIIERLTMGKWKFALYGLGAYLIFLNLFQIGQYNKTVLHFDDMNFRYYKAIYLKSNPSPMDFSLLDTGDVIAASDKLHKLEIKRFGEIKASSGQPFLLTSLKADNSMKLKYRLSFTADERYKTSWIAIRLFDNGNIIKERKFRMAVPRSKAGKLVYEAAFRTEMRKLPPDSVQISIESFADFEAKNALFELKHYK